MTTEERLDRLEGVSEKLTELTMTVANTAQRQEEQLGAQQELLGQHQAMLAHQQEQLDQHQKMLGDIVSILQRQQGQLDDIVGIIERQQEQLDEVRQDAKMTRRLWVRLATKYGWLDEDDLDGDGG